MGSLLPLGSWSLPGTMVLAVPLGLALGGFCRQTQPPSGFWPRGGTPTGEDQREPPLQALPAREAPKAPPLAPGSRMPALVSRPHGTCRCHPHGGGVTAGCQRWGQPRSVPQIRRSEPGALQTPQNSAHPTGLPSPSLQRSPAGFGSQPSARGAPAAPKPLFPLLIPTPSAAVGLSGSVYPPATVPERSSPGRSHPRGPRAAA